MSRAGPDALPALQWSDWDTRYLFFTGKGGLGKTTTASAVATVLGSPNCRSAPPRFATSPSTPLGLNPHSVP
jgi:DNA polymerase III delta prime subunit